MKNDNSPAAVYERFKLEWMLAHGYTLQDLVAELEKLREETKKQLAGMQHKYDTEHDRISDEILQSMIKDVSR